MTAVEYRPMNGSQNQVVSFLFCDGEGQEVVLGFSGGSSAWTMKGQARAIPGRQERILSKEFGKVNIYPFFSLPAVVEFADKWGLPVDLSVRALVPIAKARQAEAVRRAEEKEAARVALPNVRLDEAGRIVLDRPEDSETPRLSKILREINYGHPTWDPIARAHLIHFRLAEKVQEVVREFGLSVSPEAQEVLDREPAEQRCNFEESSAATAEPVYVLGLDEDVRLKALQWAGIRWCLRNRQTFIADKTGFGKSVTALGAVAADNAYPLVIVCPPSLVLNWKKELGRFPYLRVFAAEGREASSIPPDVDVVVIGSAALGFADSPSEGEAKVFAWAKAIAALQPKALILDESQMAKEESAGRTQAIMEIAGPIRERDGLVLILSATNWENRLRELAPQLEIMGRLDEFGGKQAYLRYFCSSKPGDRGGRFEGSKNTDKMFYFLRAYGLMLRRTDLSLIGLTEPDMRVVEIDPAELNREAMDRYHRAESDLIGFLAAEAEEMARSLGTNVQDAMVRVAMRANRAKHLVRINTLRSLIGEAKIDYAEAMARRLAIGEQKVMVATHHKQVTRALAGRLGGLKIVGAQSAKSKEADKDRFHNDPKAKFITVAVEAGGTGHTLCANGLCATGIQVETVWKPSVIDQLVGRLNRIGATRQVTYFMLVAKGTIDEDLQSIVNAKRRDIDAVMEGRAHDAVDESDEAAAADVAWRLAMRGYGGRA